jgi:hypothetical protein
VYIFAVKPFLKFVFMILTSIVILDILLGFEFTKIHISDIFFCLIDWNMDVTDENCWLCFVRIIIC